jgi:hypothetical protein
VSNRETSVLNSRLHQLADDLAPQIDVVAQVRGARERNRRQRRGRIAFLSVATAAAALLVGTTTAVDLLSASADREVAGPARPDVPSAPTTEPAPPTTEPAPTSSAPAHEAEIPVMTSGGSGAFPDGWQDRTFMGVTFLAPPGARMPDTVDESRVISDHEGPSLTWNGPLIAGNVYATVRVEVVETFEGGLTPSDGGERLTVQGAESAYGAIQAQTLTDDSGATVASRTFWMHLLDGDRQIIVTAHFAGEESAEEMIATLVRSVVVG